jgi:hypothetical protein
MSTTTAPFALNGHGGECGPYALLDHYDSEEW